MAGFLNKFKDASMISNLSSAFLNLSSLGMKYNDMVVKQSRAVGAVEAQFSADSGLVDQDTLNTLQFADIGVRKYISFFDKDYKNKREFLRKFAMNEEVEFVVDTICDETIVYDDKNFFCYPDTTNLAPHLKPEERKKIEEAIHDNFKFIYNHFHFNDDVTAWNYFRKFIVDGFLAFEIIYNEDNTRIIGFKELDSISIRPSIKSTSDGSKKFWEQYEDEPKLKRTITDAQIIYISYAYNGIGRISYLERLVRSFNLLRIMENTRVIWNLMNSTYRLKMTVPIGSKSKQKAQESLNELLARYKEDVYLDFDSGELLLNGKPSMQFYKNYLFPVKDGESVDIETLSSDGPDLSDTDALKYFQKKIQVASKIPASRFDKDSGGGSFLIGADGIDREEIRFSKFINRLRSVFQELLVKPLFLQMCLDFPKLAEDEIFKTGISISYVKDNVFEQLKEQEILQKRLDFMNSLADFTDQDGSTPFFQKKWIIQEFGGFTKDQLDGNQKAKQETTGKTDAVADKSADSFSM